MLLAIYLTFLKKYQFRFLTYDFNLIGLFVLFLLLSKSSLYILDTRILTDI